MREVRLTEAKADLPRLIDAVEQGETVIITRHGRAVARLVPEPQHPAAEIQDVMREIALFRQNMPALSVAEILAARDEGRNR
ncbi:type II toxin-antitoxin system prevent-host-death family antitoxin [Niveispirillum sp. BGYR6]|uniref:type II toxin-antitoxin system Phd/YefM family antitoxin n=1 Tax=Niveispirillum sp. BGYR6 TaxID=2971249 RepID=UPI0022B990C2|nr:type II toxin-antitoxin system prevent-host-death family antitoxin [Niveispirillum sp. BGYR6]MDG5496689.1 type II toxin-antitoxin system prevent-host-death family antitoxin [Niveispirillum sp. BGYR6]